MPKKKTNVLAEKAKEKAKDFAARVKDKIALSIGAAFGLVIALAWNSAIQEGINNLMTYLGITGTTYIYKIIAAVIVTIIAVAGIIIVSKWAEKPV
ncbi:MAG: DUF5654 family protein [Candidatus Pacearchaeota archaeon]|nr:DUF5654 family protein [Candidatus Pacearchaeota archaeon]